MRKTAYLILAYLILIACVLGLWCATANAALKSKWSGGPGLGHIIYYDTSGDAEVEYRGYEGKDARIALSSDEADNDADTYYITALAAGGLVISNENDGTVFSIASGGTITIGAITLSGDLGCLDLTVAGNASVGTNLTVSGDVELGHASDTTIARASAGDVNIEGNKIYRAGGTDVPVADGGMGASSHTDGGVLLGSGSGAITAMAVLGNGAIIIGDNSTDPVAVSAFTASNGVLKVENGGTETNALTDHAVLIGSGTGPVTPLAVGTDGTVLRGSTGADPSFGAIEEGDVNIADAPSDEDILTYEAGSTNFEWHTFDEKAAGMSAGALPSDSVPRGDASTNLRTKVCCKDIEGFNASQEEYIFVAPYDCTIVKVGLVCDTATTGSDASVTNWSFQVANLTISSNLLSAAKTTGATEITGDALYDLGVDQFLDMSEGDVLEFQATKNDSPTSLATAEIMSVVEFY